MIENSKIGMSRLLDSSTTTQMAKIMVQLERNLFRHPLAELFREKEFKKILLQHCWEKVSHWECLFAHRQKALFLSV